MTSLDELLQKCGIRPIEEKYCPLSLAEIQALEAKFGSFPDEYRELVSKYGGAMFDKEVMFSLIDPRYLRISPNSWTTIDCIYGGSYNKDSWYTYSLWANIEWMEGRMPDNMIPIAESGNGHICLCLDDPNRHALFYWDRVEEPTINNNNIYLIANSFSDFLSGLRPEEP